MNDRYQTRAPGYDAQERGLGEAEVGVPPPRCISSPRRRPSERKSGAEGRRKAERHKTSSTVLQSAHGGIQAPALSLVGRPSPRRSWSLSWFARSWSPRDQLCYARLVLRAHHPCVLPRLLEAIRKCRRKYQMEMESQNTKESRAEKAKRAAEREAEKQKEDAAAEVAEERSFKRGLFGQRRSMPPMPQKPGRCRFAAKPADK